MLFMRPVAVIKCEASPGQHFVQVVSEVLENMNLDNKQCTGNSTDRASNMQGQYKDFSTLLSAKSLNQVHVLCYAHILNLVLTDTTESVFGVFCFSVMNNIAVFILPEDGSKDLRHGHLAPMGKTRWWAKDSALTNVFGAFAKSDGGLYVDDLHTLSAIRDGQSINTTA